MKKSKSIMVVLLAVLVAISSLFTFAGGKVYADNEATTDIDAFIESFYSKIYARSSNEFEFNASEILVYNSNKSDMTKPESLDIFKNRVNPTGLIPVNMYNDGVVVNHSSLRDGILDPLDGNFVLGLAQIDVTEADTTPSESNWIMWSGFITKSLADYLQISQDDIYLVVKVSMPAIEGYNASADYYEINSKTKLTSALIAKIKSFAAVNDAIIADAQTNHEGDSAYRTSRMQQVITVTATTKEGAEYKLVLGNDDNWYLTLTKPVEEEKEKEFATELSYRAFVSKKEVGGKTEIYKTIITFIPNYDKENPKKDADVTAIIKSTTNLDILTVDGVALNEDGTPNKDGWYYVDKTDKKVIAKVYPFENYNNLKDNGTVPYDKDNAENNYRGSIKVVLGSEDDLTSDEYISIQWPYRIIEDVQNPTTITSETKTVTRTVTTNLPTDEEKLPDGWKFTDTDLGKSQHQMYKEYTRDDGNVNEKPEFTENGRKDTVTTTVEIKWPEKEKLPEIIPQAGAFTIVLVIVAAGMAVFAITRYRKLNK